MVKNKSFEIVDSHLIVKPPPSRGFPALYFSRKSRCVLLFVIAYLSICVICVLFTTKGVSHSTTNCYQSSRVISEAVELKI